jgi:acetolactate synthase I/II/III large subunit
MSYDCVPMTSVADLIVSGLSDAGAQALFGVPGGGGNLDLIDAAGRIGLPFILTTTETGAALSAMAQAEISGRPGACLTTLGPGAASVTNGVACAFLDRAPLLVFTDSYAMALRTTVEHQRLDHAALLAGVTKWSATLTAETAASVMAQATAATVGPPPGPVHIDCPGDVTSMRAPEQHELVAELTGSSSPGPDRGRLRELLHAARRPLLLVGLGARRPEDAVAVRTFCERQRVPALVTYKAKGVVPDDHPWFAGVFTNGAIERPVIDESDLLIGIGLDPVELLPRPWTHRQPVIACGPWPVDDTHVPFTAQHVADSASALSELESQGVRSEWAADAVGRHVAEQRQRINVATAGLSAQRVVQLAAARLAAEARVTVDAGAHMFAATVYWPVRTPNDLLISNGLSTMGFALPAAIGAAALDRDRPVVALTGDGGLLMCLGELLTAARERLRIITIVFSDASLSLIEIKQQARRLKAAGVALGDVRWPALAEALGVAGFAASTEEGLGRAMDQAVERRGPSLIEARIDRSNYGETLRVIRGA